MPYAPTVNFNPDKILLLGLENQVRILTSKIERMETVVNRLYITLSEVKCYKKRKKSKR